MWEIFQSIGSIDKLKQKGSLQHYKKRLKKYQENEADILIDMGILCSNEEKYDESIKYLKQAQRTYYKLNYTEGRAFVFDLIGDVYLSMKEMDKALDYYKKSFQMYASIRSPLKSDELEKIREVEDIKEAIEIANAGKENAEISEEYSIEEVESSEQTSNPENYVECHLNYEKVNLKLEKILKLIRKKYKVKEISKEEYETGYIQKSIYDARDEGNGPKEMALFLVTGYYFMNEQKQYSALKRFKEAFKVARKTDDKKGQGFSLLLIGAVYYILSSKNKIYEVFKKSLEIFRDLKYKEGESAALELMNTLYNEDVCTDEEIISKV
ncbi:MAG: tetratricopeptide repeat protein [Methanobacterium sp.]|nr:tetratricopeptide repeat protein [Methanobacterium sp.]